MALEPKNCNEGLNFEPQKCKEGNGKNLKEIRYSHETRKVTDKDGNFLGYGTLKGNRIEISPEPPRFTHQPTGQTGVYVRTTHPTGKPTTMVIKLDDGREYFAPLDEFKQI